MSTPQITDPKEKISAALGALFFAIPHFTGKKTEFVTLYMRQSFGLLIAYVTLQIFLKIFVIFTVNNGAEIVETTEAMSRKTGGFLILILNVFTIAITLLILALAVLALFLIYKAYKGERYEQPILLKYTNLLISKVPALQTFFSPKN